jgi:type VI protein secretion system component Hcp
MAVNMFLKMDGIPGESQDKDYRDTIEGQGWSWVGDANDPKSSRSWHRWHRRKTQYIKFLCHKMG